MYDRKKPGYDKGEYSYFAIERLGDKAARMRQLAIIISSLTFLNIGSAFAITIFMGTFDYIATVDLILTILPVIILFLTLIVILSYDQQRRLADIIFEEVSDSLETHTEDDSMGASQDRPDNWNLRPRLRSALREYSVTAALPLVPGRMGPGVYALLNVLITLITIAFINSLRYG